MGLAILAATLADLVLREPKTPRHPVALAGRLMSSAQRLVFKSLSSSLGLRLAGLIVTVLFVGGGYLAASSIIKVAGRVNSIFASIIQIGLIWLSISVGELTAVGGESEKLISEGRIELARQKLTSLVGRDVDELSVPEIRGAVLESMGENLVDAGIAPLFFAAVGGAPLAVAYRLVNTLDSMFGYKDGKNFYFGWAAAKLDDLVNWVPARLGVVCLTLAAFLCGRHPASAWRAARSDGRKHDSPNSGLCIAALAGSLGVRLGGERSYSGVERTYGFFGSANREFNSLVIAEGVLLVRTAMLAMTAFCLAMLVVWGRLI